MTPARPKLGYVEVTTEAACPLFGPGQAARGHVCHNAEILQERVVRARGIPSSHLLPRLAHHGRPASRQPNACAHVGTDSKGFFGDRDGNPLLLSGGFRVSGV